MPGQSGVALVAVLLPRPEAARAVTAAWDQGEAVLVLDPSAPDAATTRLVDQLGPTHLVDGGGRHDLDGEPVPEGTAAVVVTSGTSGAPKGVELTVRGAEAIGAAFTTALGVEPDDRALVCLPVHHVAGLAILARARSNRTPVLVHPTFDPDAVAAAPRVEGATVVSLVPTMLHRLLDAGAPFHEYRHIVLGGAPTPPELRARAEAMGAPVVDAYGSSETWGGVVLDGEPVVGAEVMLADDAEVLVRGPMVMQGYRNDPGATAASFTADGWYRTGDIGTRDPDGKLRVVDRARDIVITGGVNVSPTAVEETLRAHPLVADVCVIGAPDAEWGERVVACLVPRDASHVPNLDTVRSFGRDAGLSEAQLPRAVVIVDVIPRTTGGKVLRRELRVPE